MTSNRDRQHQRRASAERDRALARVTKVTVAGGAGAVLATGALAAWLALPANAKPGSAAATSSSSGSSSSGSSSGTSSGGRSDDGTSSDGGLQLPDQAPNADSGGSGQQPPVSSGGS
jgi:hypothetical protein